MFLYSRLGNFGKASGAQMWYWGQHAKVCTAMKSGDIKAAVEAAVALNDLGVNGKKPEEVLASPELLKAFGATFASFAGKMPSYDSDALSKGANLIAATLASFQPPTWVDNRWICDPKQKPTTTTGETQYYCCPSGWVKSVFNDPMPCINEKDLFDCGPLPSGATKDTHVCCNKVQQWFPKDPAGKNDPCHPFNLKPSEILAPDIVVPTNNPISGGMIVAGVAALAMVIVLTFILKKD